MLSDYEGDQREIQTVAVFQLKISGFQHEHVKVITLTVFFLPELWSNISKYKFYLHVETSLQIRAESTDFLSTDCPKVFVSQLDVFDSVLLQILLNHFLELFCQFCRHFILWKISTVVVICKMAGYCFAISWKIEHIIGQIFVTYRWFDSLLNHESEQNGRRQCPLLPFPSEPCSYPERSFWFRDIPSSHFPAIRGIRVPKGVLDDFLEPLPGIRWHVWSSPWLSMHSIWNQTDGTENSEDLDATGVWNWVFQSPEACWWPLCSWRGCKSRVSRWGPSHLPRSGELVFSVTKLKMFTNFSIFRKFSKEIQHPTCEYYVLWNWPLVVDNTARALHPP